MGHAPAVGLVVRVGESMSRRPMESATRVRVAALGCVAACILAFGTGAPAARAATGGFPSGIWTLQDENASITATRPTDRYYVNGLQVTWTSNPGHVPGALAALGHAVWGNGTQRISLGLLQKIYTPADTKAINPPLNDEPYAGLLVAQIKLIQDTDRTRSVLGLDAGVIGRDAGAQIMQNGFHTVIGQSGTHGWAYQLPSEPALDAIVSRTWRFPTGHLFGLETDALPQIGGMVGLTEDYVQPAVMFRIGQGLNADFGPPLIRPGASGSHAYTPVRNLSWYFFAGVAGKFIAHDEFLQGSNFQDSRHVTPIFAVGSLEAGIAVIWHGVRISYTQVFQTKRFVGQRGGIHEYGSLAVSALF